MAAAAAYVGNDELWRNCALWLTRWDVLRSDHRVNWPQATIVDLANTLRDGVLLCKLLSRIDPNCIDMKSVNLKPTMAQFLCLRNIDIFLETCVVSFGLKPSDLFDKTMLFHLTNFHKVLCTLSKLSLSPKALRSNIPGFCAQNVKTKSEEDIYHSLKTLDDPLPLRGSQVYEQYGYAKREEIYHDLCSLQALGALELVQAQTLEKRDFVIKELIDTERNYVEVLSKLKKNFMKPLQQVLDEATHNIIFYKISELHEIHTGFLSQLTSVNNESYGLRLSDVFLRWSKKFLVYASYCANLTKACSLLQEKCDNDDNFNQLILKHEKEDNNGKFKLRDVLTVPMQRILKYHLLLEKLIENTEHVHDEYNDLKRAKEAMLDVAGYINEADRDSEHIAVIKNLQDNIVEWQLPIESDLVLYGRLIKDGEIKIKPHTDQRTKSRYVFIFNRAMFICKQMKGNQFAFREVLNLAEYHVEETNGRATLNREARWSYSWLLVKNDKSVAYTLSVRSPELKLEMMNALKEAIDNLKPISASRSSHKFEMYTFAEPQTCNHCSKYLKGLLYQGYKCLTCNTAVHKECILSSGKCGAPPLPPHPSNCNAQSRLGDKLWFAGVMDRNEASALLEGRSNGTYLVRIRPHSNDKDKFALSLKTDNTVKHMKICNNNSGNKQKYYLSLSKYFNSIEELIQNYQQYSLKENFERLEENTKLEWPYKQLVATVIEDFEPQDGQHLGVREGDSIIIIGKEGYRDGWYRARSRRGIGFVPKQCIREEREILYDYF